MKEQAAKSLDSGSRKLGTGCRKGQASAEMLATVGLVLLLLIPVVLLLLVGAQVRFESLSQVQAASSARLIADSINEIYLEGPHSAKVAVANLPSNTKSVALSENEVIITLETRDGETQIAHPFFGVLADGAQKKLEGARGILTVRFSADEEGRVNVEYGTE